MSTSTADPTVAQPIRTARLELSAHLNYLAKKRETSGGTVVR